MTRVLPHLRALADARRAGRPSPSLTSADLDRFLGALTRRSAEAAFEVTRSLVARGIPPEAIAFELLPAAARRLGEWWDADRTGFVDVSIAMCRLHEVLRRISDGERRGARPPTDRHGKARSVLLTTAGRDPHILGLMLLAERFHAAGWRTRVTPGTATPQIRAELGRGDFDVIGISATRGVSVEAFAAEIDGLRRASRNRRLVVLVGGRSFDEAPELVARVGADLAGSDVTAALEQCERLCDARRLER